MEPFHAIPNDLLSGPLPEGPSDPLLRAQSDTPAAADSLASFFAPSHARLPFSSGLGPAADTLASSSATYAQGCPVQSTPGMPPCAFDAQPPLLSSLHTPSASGSAAASFARPLTPGSPLGAGMLLPSHGDSPQIAAGQHGPRQYLPLGSASYGPSPTAASVTAEAATQRGRSLGGPVQSLADDLWPRQQPTAADSAELGAGLDWGACLPGTGGRHPSCLGHGVLPDSFGAVRIASSPRSQDAYGRGDDGLYGSDRGVGLLPGDAAAVWGRPQQKLQADDAEMLRGGELAGRWSDDLRGTIGADPGGLWMFAPPAGTTADRREHDAMSSLGAAAARMHAAAAAATPGTTLGGLDRTAGQGLFAFGAPGASVFGAGGSSWSALPEPQNLADRGPVQVGDEGAGFGLMDMPSFLKRDLPYSGPGVSAAMDPGGVASMATGVDMVVQDSVRSGGGSQWSESSQAQRKPSEFNVHAAEFQVRRPRMSSKELCLPNDLIE